MNKNSTLFLAFVGQNCMITTNLLESDNEEQIATIYQGIIIDYDDEYIYLGDENAIDQAISKKIIIHIGILQKQNLAEQILNSMPDPKLEEVN